MCIQKSQGRPNKNRHGRARLPPSCHARRAAMPAELPCPAKPSGSLPLLHLPGRDVGNLFQEYRLRPSRGLSFGDTAGVAPSTGISHDPNSHGSSDVHPGRPRVSRRCFLTSKVGVASLVERTPVIRVDGCGRRDIEKPRVDRLCDDHRRRPSSGRMGSMHFLGHEQSRW